MEEGGGGHSEGIYMQMLDPANTQKHEMKREAEKQVINQISSGVMP